MKKKNDKVERKIKVYSIMVSKLAYLEARKLAERHKVWWSRIIVTEMGDPMDGKVNVEFKAKIDKESLIDYDLAYVRKFDNKVTQFIYAGRKQFIEGDMEP